jgi:putative MATE family efflux protein
MGLGIAGAAYATVISQTLAFFVGLYILMSGRTFVKIGFKKGIYFVRSLDVKLLTIGLPTGIEGLLRNLGSFLIMRFIASYGVGVVAAYGICTRIVGLISMPIFGLQMGTSVIVGQSLGCSDIDRAEKAGYLTAGLSFWILLAAGAVLFVFPANIMSIFTDSAEIINIGIVFLRYFAVAALFMGPAGSLASILFGAGDNTPSMLGALISVWGVQLPLLYVFVNVLGLSVEWVWATYIFAYMVQFSVILYFVKRGRWKEKCVI